MQHEIVETQPARSDNLVLHLYGVFPPSSKSESDYLLIPFLVPTGTQRLALSYAFSGDDPSPSGNILDLGIFDPRGSEWQSLGFRGWSGSARRELEITPHRATPGYLPGPIYPGRWEILLGLYHVETECRYEITIHLDDALQPPPVPRAPVKPVGRLTGGKRWYRGDLHAHTHHSDASGGVADLVAAAKARGLDFLAVTDHNTVSHWPSLAQANGEVPLLIPGQEITTYYGHANAWGISAWQDFRCRSDADMAKVCESVHTQGGLFSINHPKPGGPAWEFDLLECADCIEVWQGPWYMLNERSLALWGGELRRGSRLVAVGGSDRHQPPFDSAMGRRELGHPTTWVYADSLTIPGILAGIAAGHVRICEDIAGPQLELEASVDQHNWVMMGDEIELDGPHEVSWRCRVLDGQGADLVIVSMDKKETIAVTDSDYRWEWTTLENADSFVRAELVVHDDSEADKSMLPRLAITNPIYIAANRPGI